MEMTPALCSKFEVNQLQKAIWNNAPESSRSRCDAVGAHPANGFQMPVAVSGQAGPGVVF